MGTWGVSDYEVGYRNGIKYADKRWDEKYKEAVVEITQKKYSVEDKAYADGMQEAMNIFLRHIKRDD